MAEPMDRPGKPNRGEEGQQVTGSVEGIGKEFDRLAEEKEQWVQAFDHLEPKRQRLKDADEALQRKLMELGGGSVNLDQKGLSAGQSALNQGIAFLVGAAINAIWISFTGTEMSVAELTPIVLAIMGVFQGLATAYNNRAKPG